jgi:hypothetical protein
MRKTSAATVKHQSREAFRTLTKKSDPSPRANKLGYAYYDRMKALTARESAQKAADGEDGNVHGLALVDKVI